jgi:hypothetical protein
MIYHHMTDSIKFREPVVSKKDKFSSTFEQTSARFDVLMRILFRWKNKMEPNKIRNKPVPKIDMAALKKDVAVSPDDDQWA